MHCSFCVQGYPGPTHGFVLPAVETREEMVKVTLQGLRARKWVDLKTRLVTMDLNIYNANIRMVHVVRLAVELQGSGGPLATVNIDTVRAFDFHTGYALALAAPWCGSPMRIHS